MVTMAKMETMEKMKNDSRDWPRGDLRDRLVNVLASRKYMNGAVATVTVAPIFKRKYFFFIKRKISNFTSVM